VLTRYNVTAPMDQDADAAVTRAPDAIVGARG
jgi:hypothetical protein